MKPNLQEDSAPIASDLMNGDLISPESPRLRLGHIEPHAGLLEQPPEGQMLYKLMTIENLLDSIDGAYLYFNRVDRYSDSPVADKHDGEQLPADRDSNTGVTFLKAPDFSASDYYERSRSRTYACCFGMENADYLWRHYGNGGKYGKVCVIFSFSRLRQTLNRTISPDKAFLLVDGTPCEQVMSLNYGVVHYVVHNEHRCNVKTLPNPIVYSYLKDKRFNEEEELRVTLSAPGIFAGFKLTDGRMIDFPSGIRAPFDVRAAISDGTIPQILLAPDSDAAYFQAEMDARGIGPAPGSDLPLQTR